MCHCVAHWENLKGLVNGHSCLNHYMREGIELRHAFLLNSTRKSCMKNSTAPSDLSCCEIKVSLRF